jgi:ketosteroid isomerase-like protein
VVELTVGGYDGRRITVLGGEINMSIREVVDALHTRFLEGFKRRDAIAATADYTEDAVFLAAGSEPVRGRAAIAAGLASLWESGFVEKSLTTLSADADGDLGYVIEAVETSAGSGFALLVLRRGRGKWGICAEAFIAK